MTQTAAEFHGQGRGKRFGVPAVAAILFGLTATMLWRKVPEDPPARIFAISFTVATAVLVAVAAAGAWRLAAPRVRVLMLPARPRMGEAVEFRWEVAGEIRGPEALEIALVESRQGSRQDPRHRGLPRRVRRHKVAQVSGRDAREGSAVLTLPIRDDDALESYEVRVFEVVVKLRPKGRVAVTDRYPIGELDAG